jgi:toxin ParE1/3/4
MRVRVSRRAEMDLAEITDFIALDNSKRADEFEEELLERVRNISRAPLAYAERSDLRAGLRSCVHRVYVIFFTVDEQGVRIERILHGARDLGQLLSQ